MLFFVLMLKDYVISSRVGCQNHYCHLLDKEATTVKEISTTLQWCWVRSGEYKWACLVSNCQGDGNSQDGGQ